MFNVDNKVKNIYYMLCYSFNKNLLTEKDVASVDSESFDNIYNLFSIILCIMVRKQIKKGMNREYIAINENLSTVRGKISVTESIKPNLFLNHKVNCTFDDFNENNKLNQIIKTTSDYLIKSSSIGTQTKIELKRLMLAFKNVELINPQNINWKNLIYNKNNNSYRNIIVLCELILKGLIVSDKEGNERFREFLDETALHRIYENFIKEYFRKHYNLNAGPRNLSLTDESIEYIGMMKTDVTLETKDKMLIIDAKFYDHILQTNRFIGSRIISMNNIYQINTYVENQLQKTGKKVQGMLLYAQTIDDPVIDIKVPINEKDIMIKTLDLNKEWEHIKSTLDKIAIGFIEGTL